MSEHGGVRTPSSPAMVSGPGAMSARTDGGVMNPNSPSYGEGADLESLASAAPMGAAPPGGSAPQGGGAPALPSFNSPGDPSVPITSGAALGAGPGVGALGLPQGEGEERRADARALGPALQVLIAATTRSDATQSFRRLVREALYS